MRGMYGTCQATDSNGNDWVAPCHLDNPVGKPNTILQVPFVYIYIFFWWGGKGVLRTDLE